MNIVKQMIKELSKNDRNGIYLREIALLMEEIETLKGKLRVKENLLKNHQQNIEGVEDAEG